MSEQQFRSGFVAILGRPNVGKSTLMNQVLGSKVAIVTPKPQTTRNKITGIATFQDCQIVFLDTPGIHEARGGINRLMVEAAYSTLEEADAVCLVVDGSSESGRDSINPENEKILQRLDGAGKPVVLVVNKVDLVRKEKLLPVLDRYSRRFPLAALIPASALSGDGIPQLVTELQALIPPGEKFFPDGTLTDRSRSFIITEFIREQIFLRTRQEVPYSTAVSIDLAEERTQPSPLLHVVATIHVERNSQKGMLVGKQGQMIKQIGQSARQELERYLGTRLFLELHVRVEKEWTRSIKGMNRVGYEP